jgi:hypothetical protein
MKHEVITKSTVSIPVAKIVDFVNTFAGADQEKVKHGTLITTIVTAFAGEVFVEFVFSHQETIDSKC